MVDASIHFGILQHYQMLLTNGMKQLRYAAPIWYTEAAVAYMNRAFGGLLIVVMHAELLHIIIWQDAEVTLQMYATLPESILY